VRQLDLAALVAKAPVKLLDVTEISDSSSVSVRPAQFTATKGAAFRGD
jgi:hypothetical protein